MVIMIPKFDSPFDPTWETIMILLSVTHEAAIPSKEDLSLLSSPCQLHFLWPHKKKEKVNTYINDPLLSKKMKYKKSNG